MTEYPIKLEWEISEDRLKALKNSTKNECLQSDIINVIPASNFEYSLVIYPNGNTSDQRGETGITLNVDIGKEKKVEAEYTFIIESANWNHKINYVFEKNEGYGNYFCTVDELFDSTKKFIVDGKLTVKFYGIFKIENVESKENASVFQPWEMTKKFYHLRNIGFEDFTIVANGKEIKIHKCVLASHSTVFCAMFKSKLKEGIENRVEIVDFSFEVVEKAIHLCYHQKNVSDFSIKENALLLKFSDKYDAAMIKENIETYLSNQITVLKVCEMVKIAAEGNAQKLQKKCMDFFVECLTNKYCVPNMELLDNEFLVTAIKNSSWQKSQTL